MTAQEIRKKYLDFFAARGHKVIPRANLVPQDDPTTLFTGSGMQPMVPYLLGEKHPEGTRIADSQPCFRAEDIEEVGDNRHLTLFEMLGNWSLGDYYKDDQISWAWELYTKVFGLDPQKLYITCFIGDEKTRVPKDTESAELWKKLYKTVGIDAAEVELPGKSGAEKGMQNGRIFYYDASKNWWSREGAPSNMRDGEPGGPDTEIFYDFGTKHDSKFGEFCHPNCDCGRFGEIGNSVFMAYRKNKDKFEPLPNPNVDFGGGLERIAAAVNNDPDLFKTSVIWPIVECIVKLSGKQYKDNQAGMRFIADHMRAATFLAIDDVTPSNKTQGYVLRRLIRRAIRYAYELGIENDLGQQIVPVVVKIFAEDYPEMNAKKSQIIDIFSKEEKLFRQTLRKGLNILEKALGEDDALLTGQFIFQMYDTYGFPVELTLEEAHKRGWKIESDWRKHFDTQMEQQIERSQTAAQGIFKGGLADHSDQVIRYHTVTHLMYQALKDVLGKHVVQRGSNITSERTRFDFSHPEKVTPEQIKEVEDIVNQKIVEDLPVTWKEEKTEEAFAKGASGAFGDKYGDKVKVYTIGDPKKPFSREICGGPHVERTSAIGEGGKKFKIVKEESSSAGVRRIKAVLV
ncbi:MAG TPA: alanine--tRNA ligase [Candidatus Saccharimonadales bacterium]|nr:alanine--tRNA ligase [Candidatus Saccharimonadales bacterium]